jgi:rhodanese-related sulfurtransferase
MNKPISLRITIALFAIILIGSCTAQKDQNVISERMGVEDFEKKMNELDNEVLLDVRTIAEYNAGHLANSKNVDFYLKDVLNAQLNKMDKNIPVLVYCAVGGRSNNTRQLLADKGFKEVYELKPGFNGWSAAGKSVEK